MARANAATSHRLCVAPMMEWTDRHCRYIHRLLAPNARLYTEMVTTGALIHGPRDRLLAHTGAEHPVALQLGGCDPQALATCARFGAEAGFDEINLNLGCPSDRVQAGRIGACLMAEPQLVADCLRAMVAAADVPVTIKCRLGIDRDDNFEFLARLVAAAADAGVRTVVVHARKAILKGMTPAQNRSIPPLDYERVHRLKGAFPDLAIVLNGGLDSVAAVRPHLEALDGVMIGRAAYQNPWLLTALDASLFGTTPPSDRRLIVVALVPYIDAHVANGGRLHDVTRHVHGLFNGCPGARAFRRHLAEHGHRAGAGSEVLLAAAGRVMPNLATCSSA